MRMKWTPYCWVAVAFFPLANWCNQHSDVDTSLLSGCNKQNLSNKSSTSVWYFSSLVPSEYSVSSFAPPEVMCRQSTASQKYKNSLTSIFLFCWYCVVWVFLVRTTGRSANTVWKLMGEGRLLDFAVISRVTVLHTKWPSKCHIFFFFLQFTTVTGIVFFQYCVFHNDKFECVWYDIFSSNVDDSEKQDSVQLLYLKTKLQ